MYETQSTHYQDGYEWRCSPCRSKCSIRYGSFFMPSKLPLPLMFKFLYYWTEDLQSHAFLEKHLGWSPNTVVDWKNFMRDICLEEILINPQPIGGPGNLPGTTIYSDEWASYNILNHTGFIHQTVNHSENFVYPLSGVHTQKIEGSWGGVKKRMRKSQTTNPDLLETHLIETFWRRRHKKEIFNAIVSGIRNLYTVV